MGEWLTITFWKGMAEKTAAWLIQSIPSVLLILVLVFIALKLSKLVLRRTTHAMKEKLAHGHKIADSEQAKRIETLSGILSSLVRLSIWVTAVMLILRSIGIDIAPLLAGAGIVGLAIGFGAQELVRDMISGFFMLLENQVRAGDIAIVNGTGGLVERVGLRTIVLRDASGVVHVFQNGKINTLANMTKEWSAMVFDIGVAYKEDTDRVMDIMREVGEELRSDPKYAGNILEPIDVQGVNDFADSAVVIRARLKTRPIEQWTIGREYRRRLKKAFDRKKVEIPFPHVSLYWGEKINPLVVQTAKPRVAPAKQRPTGKK